MIYNLLKEKWIPVIRKDGLEDFIKPSQIAELDNPPIKLNASRPDFNGAFIQFLIGLVQTCYPHQSPYNWRKGFTNPPNPDDLEKAFLKFEGAFNMNGDGALFMQDFEPISAMGFEEKQALPLSQLIINIPTGKTLKDNTDHFIKRDNIRPFNYGEIAIMLYTLQINAPSGGQGHRTSLRGGGPLTTVIVEQNLWQTVWANQLSQSIDSSDEFEIYHIFPWLAPLPSDRDFLNTEHHPNHVFWGMPRRIWLHETETGLTHYFTKNYGINYVDEWNHFLSPYRLGDKKTPALPIKGSYENTYANWLGLNLSNDDKGIVPSQNIVSYLQRKSESVEEILDKSMYAPQIWAFGYNMDNAKTEGWQDAKIPLYTFMNKENQEQFRQEAKALIAEAQKNQNYFFEALYKAFYGKVEKGAKGFVWTFSGSKTVDRKAARKTYLASFIKKFWKDTEQNFFRNMDKVLEHIEAKKDIIEIEEKWHKALVEYVLKEFDKAVHISMFQFANPKSIAAARIELKRFTSIKKAK